jgi:spore maturation protein CgeB
LPRNYKDGDLVWIGNWGDDERADSLQKFLVTPIRDLKLKAKVYGVRYPEKVLEELADAGIEYGGWLPNYQVPEVFSRFRVTVHVPRGPYVGALPGIPTIRPFEALACGIPLVSAPWRDTEKLFRPADFLLAHSPEEMTEHLARILSDDACASGLSVNGLETISTRHTCAHRVDELMTFVENPVFMATTSGTI